MDELEDSGDLRLLVKTYLQSLSGVPINGIVDFYQNVRNRASKSLADGTGRRPHFRLMFSSLPSISCCRWIRVKCWLTHYVFYTEVDTRCNELASVIGRTLQR